MEPASISLCVLAGSVSGAAAGWWAARGRRRRLRRGGPGRTGRSWPGGRAGPPDPDHEDGR